MRADEALDALAGLANGDAWLIHRGRYLSTTLLLGVGEDVRLVQIERGRVSQVQRGPLVMPRWTFALKGPAEDWNLFWQPVPPPGHHDLMALIKTRRLLLEGDQYPFFANLRYFKDLLALPRAVAAGDRR